MVDHLLDKHDLDWTAREYELAFATYHPGMLKYAFELAIDGRWFEDIDFSKTRDARWRIVQAARDAIVRLNGGSLFEEIMETMRRGGRLQGALFFAEEGEHSYWFLFDTLESRPNSFPAVWELAHDCLFYGQRYGAMDGYGAKPLVDELFRKAITSHRNAAVYTLLQYALPRFKEAIALAVESGNDEIAEYLTRCCA